ncbi:pirin family protein [Sneathiella aquimaris]|uniref:pirin family protein n=1 Tax=Sneathiella aquimaris TaxID=2599305 RepID=UPI001469F086|nr:pirin family protein [Sneathiella aquimaris]
MKKQTRRLIYQSEGIPASDGDGVKLTRIIGSPELEMLDPFLLLDVFESDQPDDYIGGFPSHPHRGFETVTYLLAGKMRHKDNAGNEGVIVPGGVQWMTAGRGIVHSEMPEQENGLLKGFQLWVNLPASKKMTAPGYQEFPPESIPLVTLENGGTVRLVAGELADHTVGPVTNENTTPTFMDVTLPAGETFKQFIKADHSAFIFVIEGRALVGEQKAPLIKGTLGILSDTGDAVVQASDTGARFLIVAAKSIKEPVARGGPFVMNTRAEVMQAFHDYQSNKF